MNAVGAPSSRMRRSADVVFSAAVGFMVFLVVFGGFARSFYFGFLFHAPRLDGLVQFHGLLMTAWLVLFFVQVVFIGTRRVSLHRQIGWLGLPLLLLIFIISPIVAIRGAARDLHSPVAAGPPPLLFMGFVLALLLLFAGFIVAGFLTRRRRDYHMRFMLLSCLSICGPGLFRIPFRSIPALAFLSSGGPLGLFSLDLLVLYVAIVWDTVRNRRLHPVLAIGAVPLMLLDTPLSDAAFSSAAWRGIGNWLVTLAA